MVTENHLSFSESCRSISFLLFSCLASSEPSKTWPRLIANKSFKDRKSFEDKNAVRGDRSAAFSTSIVRPTYPDKNPFFFLCPSGTSRKEFPVTPVPHSLGNRSGRRDVSYIESSFSFSESKSASERQQKCDNRTSVTRFGSKLLLFVSKSIVSFSFFKLKSV